jgi:hypothetical protein
MNLARVSSWDRLDLVYTDLHQTVRGNAAAAATIRAGARCERYEHACRALEDRGPSDPLLQAQLQELAEDYARRVTHWSARRIDQDHPPALGVFIAAVGFIGPLALITAVGADDRLAPLRWWPAAVLTIPLALPSAWLLMRSVARGFRGGTGLHEALADRLCPDCGHSLGDVPPALRTELVRGVDVGPRRCPSCSSPWPMVPPPAGLPERNAQDLEAEPA